METVVTWTACCFWTPSQKHVEDMRGRYTGELRAGTVGGSRNRYPVSCRDWGAPQGTVRYSDSASQVEESVSNRGTKKTGKKVPTMTNSCDQQWLDAVTPSSQPA